MSQTQTLLQALYISLRQDKRETYDENDYFWRLGTKRIDELKAVDSVYMKDLLFPDRDTIPTLYGIRVEIDMENPENIRLFEDITYTVGGKQTKADKEKHIIKVSRGKWINRDRYGNEIE